MNAIIIDCVHLALIFCSRVADKEAYAKKRLRNFLGIREESGLWENISLCSDVLEGAWYWLYDDKKKPKRSETVKKFIRESIDSFHSTLVTESKINISLAVFGPLGAGKSFFLNSLLNWGLSPSSNIVNGPLPSASGGSQTPIPIYVKYGESVQVLLHSRKRGVETEIWFQAAQLDKTILEDVNNLLATKFQDDGIFRDARCVELQGQFPIFRHLKEQTRSMTRSGHLQLEVEVEFVDVPGCGDETGNESINVELSKADVFF